MLNQGILLVHFALALAHPSLIEYFRFADIERAANGEKVTVLPCLMPQMK